MDIPFLIGLIGSLILVIGAAWPEKPNKKHPTKSIRNWLFAIGGFTMLSYSIISFLTGGPIFFIFLQGVIGISSILMMLNVPDKIDIPILTVASIALTIWSLYLFEGLSTIFFILGLTGIAFGYTFNMGTLKRNLSLTLGSILIAIFSYTEQNWIFFWLNVFFAIFSGYYTIKTVTKSPQ